MASDNSATIFAGLFLHHKNAPAVDHFIFTTSPPRWPV
jgi:hypothetical protein